MVSQQPLMKQFKLLGFIPSNLPVESIAITGNYYLVQVRVAIDLVKCYSILITDVAIAYDNYYRIARLGRDTLNKTYLDKGKRIVHKWRANKYVRHLLP